MATTSCGIHFGLASTFYVWILIVSLSAADWESSTELQDFTFPAPFHSVYDVINSYCSSYNAYVANKKDGRLKIKASQIRRWRPKLDLYNPCYAPACVLDFYEGETVRETAKNSIKNTTKLNENVRNSNKNSTKVLGSMKRLKVEDAKPVLRLDKSILNGAGCEADLGNSSGGRGLFGGGICIQGECRPLASTLPHDVKVNSSHELDQGVKSVPRYVWQRIEDAPCSIFCTNTSFGSLSNSSTQSDSSMLKVAVQCIDPTTSRQVAETLCDLRSRDAVQSVPCIPCPRLTYPTSWSPDDVSIIDDDISDSSSHYYPDNNRLTDGSLDDEQLQAKQTMADRLAAEQLKAKLLSREQLTTPQITDGQFVDGQSDVTLAAEYSIEGRSAAADYKEDNLLGIAKQRYGNSLQEVKDERRNEIVALTDRGSDYVDIYGINGQNDIEQDSPKRRNLLLPQDQIESGTSLERSRNSDEIWWDREGLALSDEQNYMALKAGQKEEESNEISTTPGYYTSAWGPCSVTCSTGIRTRRVICRVFIESNSSVMDLLDSNCAGEKPSESDICREPDCIGYLTHDSYHWSITGYGPCSRSCAGGLQNAVYSCLRASDQAAVKSTFCAKLPQPHAQPRLCNEQRCPPRWRVFPDGGCSAPCGGGQQKRLVRCMLDAVDAGGESLVLDNSDCQAKGHKPPPKTVLCNMAPCPPNWFIDGWSQCSVTCGVGVRHREVRCEQKISLSTVVTVNLTLCPQHDPPLETDQICDLSHIPCSSRRGSAPEGDSTILSESLSLVQLRSRGKVLLNAGSSATVIPGSKIQLYCPVRRGYDRRLIEWSRNGKSIPARGKIKINKKGVLRMRRGRPKDEGIFTCSAGGENASVTLTFHTNRVAEELFIQRRKRLAEIGVDVKWLEKGDHKGKNNETQSDEAPGPNKPFSIRELLSKSKSALESFNIHYVPSEWTPCSKTCGGSGYQSRDIACHVIEADYTILVDDELCEKRGRVKPIESRDCGLEACPQWKMGKWDECDAKVCESVGIGTRSRPLYCIAENGTVLRQLGCSLAKEDLPVTRQPCPHEDCQASWITSNWAKCSISCGGRGVSTRDVQCVWSSNGQTADAEHCASTIKPTDARPCYTMPCGPPDCRDESQYCGIILQMKMCDYTQYRQQCCHSCSLGPAAAASHRQLLRTSSVHQANRPMTHPSNLKPLSLQMSPPNSLYKSGLPHSGLQQSDLQSLSHPVNPQQLLQQQGLRPHVKNWRRRFKRNNYNWL